MSDEISDLLERAFDRIRDLEDGHAQMVARHERTFRYGKILDASDIDLSDPTNPVARIHHDEDDDGSPVKGPFVRYASWAGDRNQHTPPSPGQQFLHISPDGEMESGLLIPLGHSSAIPSPEVDGKTHVDQFGQVKRTLKQDSLTHTVGGVQLHTDTKDHKVTAPGKVQLAAGRPGRSEQLRRWIADELPARTQPHTAGLRGPPRPARSSPHSDAPGGVDHGRQAGRALPRADRPAAAHAEPQGGRLAEGRRSSHRQAAGVLGERHFSRPSASSWNRRSAPSPRSSAATLRGRWAACWGRSAR